MELKFPPLCGALFCNFMLFGFLVLSLKIRKVSRLSFEDECFKGGDNVIPKKLIGETRAFVP